MISFMDRDIRPKDIPVTLVLMGLNTVIFLICSLKYPLTDPEVMIQLGGVYWPLILKGQWWRLFTAMFLHFGASHLASNLLVMFVLGSVVEKALGKLRYVAVYLLSGMGAGVVSFLYSMLSGGYIVSAGASGALFGVMGALVILAYAGMAGQYGIDTRRVPLMLVVSIAGGLYGNENIDLAGHIGGLVTGLIITFLMLILSKRKKDKSRDNKAAEGWHDQL